MKPYIRIILALLGLVLAICAFKSTDLDWQTAFTIGSALCLGSALCSGNDDWLLQDEDEL